MVDFEPGHVPGFLGIARMEREPSAIFGGRKVDLRTAEDLSRYFRQDVLRLVHAYFDVNVDILWRTDQDDPPAPIAALEPLIHRKNA